MKLDCLANLRLGLCHSCTRGHTTRKIGNVSGIIVLRLLDDYGIAHLQPHFFSPACLRMLPSVPTARSSLGLPGTVTRPGLDGCLNWRWLPRVCTMNQPSSWSIRSASATFMGPAYQ